MLLPAVKKAGMQNSFSFTDLLTKWVSRRFRILAGRIRWKEEATLQEIDEVSRRGEGMFESEEWKKWEERRKKVCDLFERDDGRKRRPLV